MVRYQLDIGIALCLIATGVTALRFIPISGGIIILCIGIMCIATVKNKQ